MASISRWQGGANVAFERWGQGVRREALGLAHELLDGVGDPSVERHFAMCATFCVHRAVSDGELAAYCSTGRTSHLAGPAAEDLWRSPGYPELPLTAIRCERGVWDRVKVGRHFAKLPGDCGECPPCRARKAHEAGP